MGKLASARAKMTYTGAMRVDRRRWLHEPTREAEGEYVNTKDFYPQFERVTRGVAWQQARPGQHQAV